MIPDEAVEEWSKHAPWPDESQVIQDLFISRALVEMFSVREVADRLAFRGGTALHKLYINPPGRYSEDIDLVQTYPGDIDGTLDIIRETIDPWLGEPEMEKKKKDEGYWLTRL